LKSPCKYAVLDASIYVPKIRTYILSKHEFMKSCIQTLMYLAFGGGGGGGRHHKQSHPLVAGDITT
jgi:hypothetical protein